MTAIRTGDGVALHHTDHVPAGRPAATVVMLAGYCASALTWQLQVDALLAAGHRVVCLDRRNHGLSDAPEHGQRIARHGRDLDEALVQLDLRDVVLVGGSMGASTVWAYLDLVGPDRVRAVVSVDQTPKMLNADGWEHGFYGYHRDNAGTYFAEGVPDTGRPGSQDRTAAGVGALMQRLGLADPGALMGQPTPTRCRCSRTTLSRTGAT